MTWIMSFMEEVSEVLEMKRTYKSFTLLSSPPSRDLRTFLNVMVAMCGQRYSRLLPSAPRPVRWNKFVYVWTITSSTRTSQRLDGSTGP